MSRRARRWIVIAACLGIPLAIIFTGTRSFDPQSKVDPAFPAKCDAIYRQVENGAADTAAEAAAKLATAAESTREEQICARAALVGLTTRNPTGTLPEPDLSKADRCKVAAALAKRGAPRAALAAYNLLRTTGTPSEIECGKSGFRELKAWRTVKLPKCAAAARQLLTGPEKLAADAMTKVLETVTGSRREAVCIVGVFGALHDFDPASPPTPTAEKLKPRLAALCDAAVKDALGGDPAGAREDYKKQLRQSNDPASQACAVGGLTRLPAQTSFSDWTFTQANRVADWATGAVPGGPVVFGAGSKTVVIAVFWFLTLGLLLVAMRQFIRWRRERVAGPVEIKAVQLPATEKDAAGTEKDAVDVAEAMRDHLSRAGIYEHPFAAGGGDVLIDVTAALAAASDTGVVGKVFNALKDAIAIKTGYVVTTTPDFDPGAPKDASHRLVVQVDNAASGVTLCLEVYEAKSYREAAEKAAYGIYMKLSDQDEVRRRTPSFLRWTSRDALQKYHAALKDGERKSFVTAVSKLEDVAQSERANLRVQSELAFGYLTLADGTPDDNALRDASEVGTRYLNALLASLRAVMLNSYSDDAHSRLALTLGAVDKWKNTWDEFADKNDLVRLLLLAGDGPDPSALGPPSSSPLFKNHFLTCADRHWRLAARRASWPMVCWAALSLNRRRTVAGKVWPFKRLRKSIHDIILGADIAVRYERFVADAPDRHPTLLKFHLLRVRFGRVLWLRRKPAKEDYVLYNLGAAYAWRAAWFESKGDSLKGHACRNYALKCLDRSYRGAGRQMASEELDFIAADPDFATLVSTCEFKRWKARFPTDTKTEVEIAKKSWHDVFSVVAKRADAASRCWYDHLSQPLPPTTAWNTAVAAWSAGVVTWMGDELERWAALNDWAGSAASAAKRTAFEKTIEEPKLNNSRPIASIDEPTLPGDTAPSANTMRMTNKPFFDRFAGFAEDAETKVRKDLKAILGLIATRNFCQLRDQFPVKAVGYAEAWASIAVFAQKPGDVPAAVSEITAGVAAPLPPAF